MTNDLKSALTIVYGDIVAVNEKADTNATNIESNTSNIETLQTQVSTNTTQLSTNTSNIETLQQEVANLKASASGVLYNESVESGVGYELSVSENALPYGTMDVVGGMSYKSKNLASVIDNKGLLADGTECNNAKLKITDYIEVNPNEKYSNNITAWTTNNFCSVIFYDSNKNVHSYYLGSTSQTIIRNLTIPSGVAYMRLGWKTENQEYIMCNKGSTLLPYQPYFEGIRDTAVTSVVSKDSNDNLLATGEIPQEIQALNGYGWGISQSVCNYIDFENKKFVQKVNRLLDLSTYASNGTFSGSTTSSGGLYYLDIEISDMALGGVILSTFNYSNADSERSSTTPILVRRPSLNQIRFYTDKTTKAEAVEELENVILLYQLAEPIETDISSYINDNTMQFGSGGTITLNNDYGQAVPYQYTILEKVSE